MRNYSYKTLDITELYVNPDNYRYVEEVQDEISAIIAMFKVNVGDAKRNDKFSKRHYYRWFESI